MKKETKLLFIILCVLLCGYALSFLRTPSRAGVFSSSLMHQQDIREVAEIRFSIPTRAEPVEMGEITLIKDGARFYLRTANGRYPVRQELIDRFFSLLGADRAFLPIITITSLMTGTHRALSLHGRIKPFFRNSFLGCPMRPAPVGTCGRGQASRYF